MIGEILKVWSLAAAIAAGVVAYKWLPGSSLDKVDVDLVSFFGIQVAVILPAMIFAAGILRAEGLSLPEARQYQAALKLQMKFWATLLFLDFTSAALIIIGKATGWTVKLDVPIISLSLDASPLLIGLTTALGTLAALRIIPFIRGILSLQALNGVLIEKAIQARDRANFNEQEKQSATNPFEAPKGFGRVINRQ